jgi:hypothetical protein
MNEISQEHREKIRQWIQEGLSLSNVQSRLKEECGLTLTYMDVRFLILDMGLDVYDRKAQVPAADDTASPADAPAADQPSDDWNRPDPLDPSAAAGGVSVEVSPLARPGSLLGGTVRFSDGMTANWSLDQFGQLGLVPEKAEYRPSESDIRDFQMELRKILETQGLR